MKDYLVSFLYKHETGFLRKDIFADADMSEDDIGTDGTHLKAREGFLHPVQHPTNVFCPLQLQQGLEYGYRKVVRARNRKSFCLPVMADCRFYID